MGHSLISSDTLNESTPLSAVNALEQEKVDQLMKKDRLVNAENEKRAPPPPSKSQLTKQKREQRSKDAGKDWYNLSKPIMTDEMKQELKVLKMRQYIDPKKFYKKSPIDVNDYFEVGTVVSHAKDYYTAPNKKVKGNKEDLNFVDDLLQDREYKKYAKRRYKEIIEKKQKSSKRRKAT